MRRCYDGCPDSGLQREIDEKARCRAAIQALGYSVTYFPSGEFYMAFNARHLQVTGECRSLGEVERAVKKLPSQFCQHPDCDCGIQGCGRPAKAVAAK